MTATSVTAASHQSAVLAARAGLHAGASNLFASGTVPRLLVALPDIVICRVNQETPAVDAVPVDHASAARRMYDDGRAVMQDTGFPRFDAALGCVIRRQQLPPGRRDGRAIAAKLRQPIEFRLR